MFITTIVVILTLTLIGGLPMLDLLQSINTTIEFVLNFRDLSRKLLTSSTQSLNDYSSSGFIIDSLCIKCQLLLRIISQYFNLSYIRFERLIGSYRKSAYKARHIYL